jgi:protein involved in polysaccharide export with SLBB domain
MQKFVQGKTMKYLDRITIALVAMIALASLSGCKVDRGRLEAFLQEPRSPVSATEYRVYPPDVIAITSVRVGEINGLSQRISPDGKITLPLLNEVFVAGKTPKEIEAAIIEVSKEYYDEGDATVQVSGYLSQKFYIFGQVARPGPVPWTGTDTLLDALATSKPMPHAWFERIRIIRGPKPQQGGYLPPAKEDRKEFKKQNKEAGLNKAGAEEVMVDLNAMMKSGDLSHNILLRPNDIIYVQPHPLAAVGLALQEMLFPTRPVLQALRIPYAAERATDPDRGYGESSR